MSKSKWLCQIGLHKWSKTRVHHIAGSNVDEVQKQCMRCHKIKKWIQEAP